MTRRGSGRSGEPWPPGPVDERWRPVEPVDERLGGSVGRFASQIGRMSLVRWAVWRLVLVATGGLRVAGRLPADPCVIVANHASHADTVALLAAVPPRRRPVVAAAADYWFARSGRAVFCRFLIGGFPIHRDGNGTGELLAARSLLAQGRDVIVFPEGTRSRDGSIGDFHRGAALLAQRAGVPLVPVGIVGTRELMPIHGRPGRAEVSVRIGDPTNELAVAEADVRELARAPRRHRRADAPSSTRKWAAPTRGCVSRVLGYWVIAVGITRRRGGCCGSGSAAR